MTITGALDDALASMLGGVVVTDNRSMHASQARGAVESQVMLLVPERKLFSRDTDVSRSRLIAPLADVAFDLAMRGDYGRAMTLNGLAYCAALRPARGAHAPGPGGRGERGEPVGHRARLMRP